MLSQTNSLIKFCAFNCNGFKANFLAVNKLIKNFDICFFSEHWLGDAEEHLFNELCYGQRSLFRADYSNYVRDANGCKGRPFGGTCWIVRDNLMVLEHSILNRALSKLTIADSYGTKIVVYGIWQPFDDGSPERLSCMQSSITILQDELADLTSTNVIIMGDFNADLNKCRRFDNLLRNFITRLDLRNLASLHGFEFAATYLKGQVKGTNDHIICNNFTVVKVESFEVLDFLESGSDHKPVACSLMLPRIGMKEPDAPIRYYHRFPWTNVDFQDLYINMVDKLAHDLINFTTNWSPVDIALNLESEIRKILLKSARFSEKSLRLKTANGIQRHSILVCSNYRQIVETMKLLRKLKADHVPNTHETVKQLRKTLRALQRKSYYNRDRDFAFDLDRLRFAEPSKFWGRISSFKKTCSKTVLVASQKPNREDFCSFYSGLFSHDDRPSNACHLAIQDKVKEYSDRLKSYIPGTCFQDKDINQAVYKLKLGKSPGIDHLTNEFFYFGSCERLDLLLTKFFNALYTTGILPRDFNTAIVIPIPKSDKVSTPADYRPISISTPLATIFESLLLHRMNCLNDLSPNQFGYRRKTSCKNAFFAVNEAIAYYEGQKTNVHVVSLDAAKAFDKLWREGLFFKLKDAVEPATWRLLYNYYACSQIVVKVDGCISNPIRTTQGIKQGGVLSGYLFNYFMDDLINECLNLKLGARIGELNLSCVAYCDDVNLLSTVKSHMDKLLAACFDYADRWKVKFNASKSTSFSLFDSLNNTFEVKGTVIPAVNDGFVFLGLPIGTLKYTAEYLTAKFAKAERAFYSLRGIGCVRRMLPPKTMAFIYRQYCQSICRYGLESIYVDKKTLETINVRQSNLLKYAVGIGSRSRTTSLLQCLGVEQFAQLYHKHKVFGLRQFCSNDLTRGVLDHLTKFYESREPVKRSYFHQLRQLESQIGCKVQDKTIKQLIESIDASYASKDLQELKKVDNILNKFNTEIYNAIAELQQCLKSF